MSLCLLCIRKHPVVPDGISSQHMKVFSFTIVSTSKMQLIYVKTNIYVNKATFLNFVVFLHLHTHTHTHTHIYTHEQKP
jgi:hypothetical protein